MDVGVSSSTYSVALTGRKVDELLTQGEGTRTEHPGERVGEEEGGVL